MGYHYQLQGPRVLNLHLYGELFLAAAGNKKLDVAKTVFKKQMWC